MILANVLTEITKSIRAKHGYSNTMSMSSFASEILSIEVTGDPGGGEISFGTAVTEWDLNGFPTKIRIKGISAIPIYYLYMFNSSYGYYGKVNYIEITDPVNSIGIYAFTNLTMLTYINLNEGITSIGNYAFYGCSVLDLILPSTVTSIGIYAFYGCFLLGISSLPSGITSIGSYTFYECSNITINNLPTGVTVIGSRSFKGCSKITVSQIPIGVIALTDSCFYGCSSILSMNAPNVATVYGASSSTGAFYGCSAMTSLTVGSPGHPVTSFGRYTLYLCNALTSITLYTNAGKTFTYSPWGATNATVTYINA